MSALLTVDNLSVSYRRDGAAIRAVDGVDLTVPAGVMLGLVGESGCGKSTLARALMGVLPGNARIEGGSICLDGEDLLHHAGEAPRTPVARHILCAADRDERARSGVPAARPDARGADRARRAVAAAADRRAELFGAVGLNARRLEDFPHQFSGGMRQRAAIAMALALSPKLIIADEPVTALDVIVQRQVLDTLRALGRELGLAAIIVTHDISVVAYLCGITAVMYAGRIVEQGPVEAPTSAPAHPYTMGLMNASPDPYRVGEPLVPIEGAPPDLAHPPPGCRFAPRCPFVLPACRETDPEAVAVGEGHRAACLRRAKQGSLRELARKAATWSR